MKSRLGVTSVKSFLCASPPVIVLTILLLFSPTAIAVSQEAFNFTAERIEQFHPADLYFPGDKLFDQAFLEAIRAGEVPTTNTYPRFGAELYPLAHGAGTLDSESLGKVFYKSGLTASFSSPTLFYDSPAQQGDLASNLLSEPSLNEKFLPEIQHFLKTVPDPAALDLRIYAGQTIAFKLDLFFNYRRDRIVGQSSTVQWDLNQWMGNLFGAAEFPRNAYISVTGENYGLAIGRFPAGMGWGRLTGSVLNPRASWYDQIRFYLSSGNLRFTSMLATSSAQLSYAEQEIQFRRKTDGSSFWDSLNDHDYAGEDAAIKLANWHQVEWRPAPWISLNFAEMSVIGGRPPSLAFVLPSVLWHSAYAAGYSNVGASLGAAFVPTPGLLISGELFIDDMRSYDEPVIAKPQAFAWSGTARWTKNLSAALGLDLGFEYGHADRWTYLRWNPYLAMYQRQTLTGGYYGLDQSLGAPWGPDHDSIGAYARLSGAGGSYLELSYELIRKGPIYQGMGAQIDESVMNEDLSGDSDTIDKIWVPVFYDYDKYAGTGALAAILARPDEYRHLISLLGNYPLGKGLELKLSTTLGFYQNFGNTAGVAKVMILAYIGILYRIPTGAK